MPQPQGIGFSGKLEDVDIWNRNPLDGILARVQILETLKNTWVCQGVCASGGQDAIRLTGLSLRDQLPDAFSFARWHFLCPSCGRGPGAASWLIKFGLPTTVERLGAEGFKLVEDNGNVVVELPFPFNARGPEHNLRPGKEGPQGAPGRSGKEVAQGVCERVRDRSSRLGWNSVKCGNVRGQNFVQGGTHGRFGALQGSQVRIRDWRRKCRGCNRCRN